jgi:hypothetical protein
VIEALRDESPDAARRIVARLKERCLRASADLLSISGGLSDALWRDPLDELIGELERTLPTQAESANFGIGPPLADLHAAIHAILQPTPEARARAEQDPHVQAFYAYYAKRRCPIARERPGSDGDKNT